MDHTDRTPSFSVPPDRSVPPDFSVPVDVVAQRWALSPDIGLDPATVLKRRADYGPNQLSAHKTKSLFTILLHQLKGVIVWLLIIAAGLSFAFHDIAEGSAILVVLLINTLIGFSTELRAVRSMEALVNMARMTTRVRRDGRELNVDAQELVPGDLVVLEAGDVVTADLRLVQVSNLRCDESVLTGESAPITKQTDPVAKDAALGDRFCMVFKGTAIRQGTGEGIVTATGMDTELGRITHLVHSADAAVSPLETRLDRLGHRLVWLTLALAALTVFAGVLRGHDIAGMIQTGVALAVAAVPEGLPVVATLSLARGMLHMAARNAVISNLSSVETLGATTVILTDKTGTLTENRMTVVRYLLAGTQVDVEAQDAEGQDGEGQDGEGQGAEGQDGQLRFHVGPTDWPADGDARLSAALQVGALCNAAFLGPEEGPKERPEEGPERTAASGDPMEIALLRVAEGTGCGRDCLLHNFQEIAEHAFDPDLKMMATVHQNHQNHKEGAQTKAPIVYAIKGAPEAVLASCTSVLGPDGPVALTATAHQDWTARSHAAAADGLRLLGLAMKYDTRDDADPYQGLTFVGLVCLRDPLRADVPGAVAAARAAGVRVVMLTGDHAQTAAAIARQAGLAEGEITVIEDSDLSDLSDLDHMSEAERAHILAADVFARVAPETKLKLASLFQESGHIVAMTGDGVNDAPALKKADIGIAMGLRGTDVAREAAHMVLKDDSLATIIAAMRQGRMIFDNIRKFVVYLMSCNVSEVLIVGLAVAVGLPVPLLPLQILFLNLVTDVFPAFALGLGPGDDRVMDQPPRPPAEPIVDRRRWIEIGVFGVAITIATLSAFLLALNWLNLTPELAVTVAFVTLALAQLWNVFNLRMADSSVVRNEVTRNPWIWAAIGFCLGLISLALWLPGLSDVLQLPDPGASGLILAAVASLLPLGIGQGVVAWIGRQKASPPARARRN